jgi:hypothetical protein
MTPISCWLRLSTLDTLSDDLVEYFKPKARDHIPEEFTKENVEGDREAQPATDWGHHTAAQKLAREWQQHIVLHLVAQKKDRQLEEPLGQCL